MQLRGQDAGEGFPPVNTHTNSYSMMFYKHHSHCDGQNDVSADVSNSIIEREKLWFYTE